MITPNGLGTKDVKVFAITTLSEVEAVIDYIKNYPAIVDISSVKNSHKQRALDLLVGAVKALDKLICTLDKNNYMIISKT